MTRFIERLIHGSHQLASLSAEHITILKRRRGTWSEASRGIHGSSKPAEKAKEGEAHTVVLMSPERACYLGRIGCQVV